MTGEEIQKTVNAICKKAGHIVGHLSDPSAYSHLVYEMARLHLSHLVGKDAIHGDVQFQDSFIYDKALDILDREIRKAVAETKRQHA